MSTIRPTPQAEVDSLPLKMDKLVVSLEFSDSDSSTDHELDDHDSESDYDLDDLTIKEIFALMPTFSPSERRLIAQLRGPRPDLPTRWQVTPENPRPELVVFGMPVSCESIFGVAREFCEENNLEYPGSCAASVRVAMKILNKVCRVDHLTLHSPTVAVSQELPWMIGFYTNRNTVHKGFPNEKEERRLTNVIKRMLKLPERPPNVWFWVNSKRSTPLID